MNDYLIDAKYKGESMDSMLDTIFDKFDILNINKRFDETNDILKDINVEETDTTILIGILVINYSFKNKIPFYNLFMNKVKTVVRSRYSIEEANHILEGI